MGLRSWLSPVTTPQEWNKAAQSIEAGPFSHGIRYVIKLEQDIPHFKAGEVVIAWSGDGSVSVEDLEQEVSRERTWLLDNYLEEFPDWHSEPGGPRKFGRLLTSDQDVLASFPNSE